MDAGSQGYHCGSLHISQRSPSVPTTDVSSGFSLPMQATEKRPREEDSKTSWKQHLPTTCCKFYSVVLEGSKLPGWTDSYEIVEAVVGL